MIVNTRKVEVQVQTDEKAYCSYISLGWGFLEPPKVERTVPFKGKTGQINLDLDADGNIIGIELIGWKI